MTNGVDLDRDGSGRGAVRDMDRTGGVAVRGGGGRRPGAVELCISLAGMMCLWTGVMEIMGRPGWRKKLSRLLRPVLGLIFPRWPRDREIMDSIAANRVRQSAGIGERGYPLGIEAARRMGAAEPGDGP